MYEQPYGFVNRPNCINPDSSRSDRDFPGETSKAGCPICAGGNLAFTHSFGTLPATTTIDAVAQWTFRPGFPESWHGGRCCDVSLFARQPCENSICRCFGKPFLWGHSKFSTIIAPGPWDCFLSRKSELNIGIQEVCAILQQGYCPENMQNNTMKMECSSKGRSPNTAGCLIYHLYIYFVPHAPFGFFGGLQVDDFRAEMAEAEADNQSPMISSVSSRNCLSWQTFPLSWCLVSKILSGGIWMWRDIRRRRGGTHGLSRHEYEAWILG